MKHPNRSGRGKHFTKGKYVTYLKESDDELSIVKTKLRKTSRARVRIYKYDGKAYKVRYRKIILLAV
jgi:sensor histidine kinase regulating citrate/malate metabolism